jgi:hypothetical protein
VEGDEDQSAQRGVLKAGSVAQCGRMSPVSRTGKRDAFGSSRDWLASRGQRSCQGPCFELRAGSTFFRRLLLLLL